MSYLPLTQQPLGLPPKNQSRAGEDVLASFVRALNKAMSDEGIDKLWYQPDNTPKWPYRYFWIYLYDSDKRDFIVRANFRNRDWFQVQFSHFGARIPSEIEFMSDKLASQIQYQKGWPPLLEIQSESDVKQKVPLIADHFKRIAQHLNNGGKLPLRGASHLEIAIGNFLRQRDDPSWERWHKPLFLGQKDLDLALTSQRVAIEVQGDYWHRLPGAKQRDAEKRVLLLANNWSLIWAWESLIKENFGIILDALAKVRSGKRFIELKKQ